VSERRIVLAQARAAIVVALRTPRALVFTFLFPLIFLILFNSIFIKGGDQSVTLPTGLKLSAQAYFMAGITAYSISLSTFTTLAVSITTQREHGQLKRLRGTPMPAWTFILAQILRATAQALAMTVLLVAIGGSPTASISPARASSASSSTSGSARQPSARSASPSLPSPPPSTPLRRSPPSASSSSPSSPASGSRSTSFPTGSNRSAASSPSSTSPSACRAPSPPKPAASAWKAATSPSSSPGPWPASGSPPGVFVGSRRPELAELIRKRQFAVPTM
jgi:hypothetical protein